MSARTLRQRAATPRRYYIHGDCEAGGDRYYCKKCDVFEEPEHFAEGDHLESPDPTRRIEVGLLTLRRLIEKGEPVFRPVDAENLFDAGKAGGAAA